VSNKIHIIGMGDDGLEGITSPARKIVEQADLLLGAESALAKIPPGKGERLVVGTNLDEAVERISQAGKKRLVILASGDPLFYGVARYATNWARTALRSCRTSAACNWPLHGSKRVGKRRISPIWRTIAWIR